MKRLLFRLLLTAGILLLFCSCAAAGQETPQQQKLPAVLLAASALDSGRWARSPVAVNTPAPPPTPEPSPEPTQAEVALASMDLREKLCQLFIVYPTDLSKDSKQQVAGDMRQALEQMPVGGMIFNGSNLKSQAQITAMNTELQALAEELGMPALFLACDEEGGRVARLMTKVGTRKIGPMLDYEDQGGFTAFQNAEIIAQDMVSCGFNLDFAPVADVWSNPKNKVIGDRAYSTDFERAAWLVKNAVHGFHSGGVACTLKHFPGHGDTAEDSHSGAAFVYKTLEELRAEEFLPFKAGIAAGADLVMVGHITVPSVSEDPALLSPALLGLLREELGFSGVIITDALSMGAVRGYTAGELAVFSMAAGVDMLLCSGDPAAALEALEAAVADGTLSEERINESVLRILTVKEQRGLLN